jgi:DNA-binding protein YbaB
VCGVEGDPESLDGELRDLEERTRRAREELAELAVEAKSKDGLVTVIVGGHGRLHELRLDPRVKRLDVDELAERVVGMTNDALDLLHHETAAKMREVFPDFAADPPFGDPPPERPWQG